MRVYLAARYSRRVEVAGYADDLRAAGHEVTSRWVAGVHEHPPDGVAADSVAHLALAAAVDVDDLVAADCLVSFTEPDGAVVGRGRGGRHVELGMALGLGKRVIVAGFRENVFCCLPQVEFYETWQTALAAVFVAGTGEAG